MTGGRDKPSPGDWVKRDQISYDRPTGVLKVQFKPGEDIKIFDVASSMSMDGYMDDKTIFIGSGDFDKEMLKDGDDIIYQMYTGLIVHRIKKITKDLAGRIYRARGINNPYADRYYLRDEHIQYVVKGQFN